LKKNIPIWKIKSTTKARDGLYFYDTFSGSMTRGWRPGYFRYSAVHQAGQTRRILSAPEQVVLLIDEIDRRNIDFPTTSSMNWRR
jgi:hypothetical protein